jgi:hypothetical protein
MSKPKRTGPQVVVRSESARIRPRRKYKRHARSGHKQLVLVRRREVEEDAEYAEWQMSASGNVYQLIPTRLLPKYHRKLKWM